MKLFENPSIEVIEFSVEDIITTSDDGYVPDEDQTPSVGF